jgi:serine/alanine adding enzyme
LEYATRIDVGNVAPPDWDAFVAASDKASVYHRSRWLQVIPEVFGHKVFYLAGRSSQGALTGALPLVQQRSVAFGNFLTSIPFYNYGGALGHDDAVIASLMRRGCELSRELGCSYIEFRDSEPRQGDWGVRTDKVAMLVNLPGDEAALSKQLGSKLRSQIKRAEREQASVHTGGLELLPDFYDVFCRNMRDLGTPVYPRVFFETLLRRCPSECLLVVVRRNQQPAAAAFLVVASGRAEIPWAACRADAKPAGFNMRLYWESLRAAIAAGCREFDFGRSTTDSGTYRFKQQWGARPHQLYWHRQSRRPGATAEQGPAAEGRLMRYAVQVWQRLPLGVANTLGPLISPGLPW